MNDYRDYLAHFGILGMKWGIRRYQNPDGSLTEAGKRRYKVGDIAKSAVNERRARNQQIQKERANEKDRKSGNRNTSTLNEARKKNINELSNKDLKDYNYRLKLEKEFAGYTKRDRKTGAQWAAGVATVALTTIATNALINSGEGFISGFVEGFIDSIR